MTTVAHVPLAASVLYYAVTVVIGRSLRHVVRQRTPARWQPYILDAITTFQLMACSLENGQVKYFYGVAAYWFTMTSMAVWSSVTIQGSSGNPCSILLQHLQGVITYYQLVTRIVCQLCGGLLSYQYARQFWRLGLHPGHTQRLSQSHCTADLTVDTSTGFVLEFMLTLTDTTLCLLTLTPFIVCEAVAKICVTCYVVTMGVHLTGMYANPINATNQTFGCHGISFWQHFLVYWVAPLTAVVVSYHVINWWKMAGKSHGKLQGEQFKDENENIERKIMAQSTSKKKHE